MQREAISDPWQESWRQELAGGTILPGCTIKCGAAWKVCLREKNMYQFTGEDALGPFAVLARIHDDEVIGDVRRGWDVVLLYDLVTHKIGWCTLDPSNPESLVLVGGRR